MRRHDNATPAGVFFGDDGPRAWLPGDSPCCRDGYARLSLIRPLQWVRPDPPTLREAMNDQYRLCHKCVQKRFACGAQFHKETGHNPNLAH